MRFDEPFEPRPATLDLWFVDLAREPGEDEWALLADDERERALRLILASKRRQAVRARAALRRVLAGYLGLDPTALRFDYGEHGKPTLARPITFNLSHSHELGLLGVLLGERELGVDIEHARPGRAFDAIAEHFFADDEAAWMRSLAPDASVEGFYRTWTHKEAYLKALGTGLSFGSRGFSLSLAAEPAALRETSFPGDRPERWRFATLTCPPGYAAAACWTGEPLDFRWFTAPGTGPDSLLADP
ncbi:4'-phosphopantetheinyl transferase family protein [Nannocystaceae bacterium ST9]